MATWGIPLPKQTQTRAPVEWKRARVGENSILGALHWPSTKSAEPSEGGFRSLMSYACLELGVRVLSWAVVVTLALT